MAFLINHLVTLKVGANTNTKHSFATARISGGTSTFRNTFKVICLALKYKMIEYALL